LSRRPVLLIAEDNDDEFALASSALRSLDIRLDIRRVPDGVACMAYLNGESPYCGMPFPGLLLLDINMPRMDGFDVMASIAANNCLRHLPVVVLSSSLTDENVNEMYRLGCSSFVRKPATFDDFKCVLHNIVQYWFADVILPTVEH
jgi:CheY-like chemotaxis protein